MNMSLDWWDEDPELLGATLGVLAAWDDQTVDHKTPFADTASSPSHDRMQTSESSSPSSSSSPPRSTSGRCINMTRERRKQETLFLRQKVAELQHQLTHLQTRREAMLQPHYADADKQQLATTAPVWGDVAVRQFRARKHAEAKNERLRTRLSAQARVVEDLIRVIRSAEQACSAPTSFQIPLLVSERRSEAEQLKRLEWNCAHGARVFAQSGRFGLDAPQRFFDMQVAKDEGADTVINVFSSSVLPFPVARVEEATWAMFEEDEVVIEDDGDAYTQQHVVKGDTVFASFASTSTMGGPTRGTISGKWISRRLASSLSQRQFVSHSFAEPSGFGNELDGALVTEDSWVRLVDAHELGHLHLSPGSTTVVQHVQRTHIKYEKLRTPAPEPKAVFTRAFMDDIQAELQFTQQLVENELLGGPKLEPPPSPPLASFCT